MTRQDAIAEISKQIPDCKKCPCIVSYCKKLGLYNNCMKQREAMKTAIEALSIDIVRCKDCEHGDSFGYREIYCTRWDKWEMPKDGFCFEGCLPEIMTPPQGEQNEEEK